MVAVKVRKLPRFFLTFSAHVVYLRHRSFKVYVVLYKDLGIKSWMIAGPYESVHEAEVVFLNGLPKICEGTLATTDQIAVALGKEKFS